MHKRTKAVAISPVVKISVNRRDNGLCVYCGKPGLPEAHYISRAKGGLGIEQNILTLCRECHRKYDLGTRLEREGMREFFRSYLMSVYSDWNEDELIYRRFK